MHTLQYYLVLASMIVLLILQLAGTVWVANYIWKRIKEEWNDIPKFWKK